MMGQILPFTTYLEVSVNETNTDISVIKQLCSAIYFVQLRNECRTEKTRNTQSLFPLLVIFKKNCSHVHTQIMQHNEHQNADSRYFMFD